MDNLLLIPTQVTDVHAQAVQKVLTDESLSVVRLFGGDFPSRQLQQFHMLGGDSEYLIETDETRFRACDVQVVWYRRPRKPLIDLSEEHPDFEFLKLENEHFINNFWALLGDKVRWVNHYLKANEANNKLLQLRVAQSLGLKVPATLVGNDPCKIKDFIDKFNSKDGVIYKAFSGIMEWEEDNSVYRQNAAKVTNDMLPSDYMLVRSSGMYQENILKLYELRVFYFGGKTIACKISTSQDEYGANDWRAIPKKELSITPYELPSQLQEKIKFFMEKMGLVTGSLDLIKSKDGEYVFLEVNESGQFIWMELENPEIKVLQPFCEFLGEQLIERPFRLSKEVSAVDLFENSEFEQQFERDKKVHIGT